MTFWVFIGRFCSTLFKQTDRLLITMFFGPTSVAEYEVVTKVPYVLKSTLGQVNEVVMSASSFVNEDGDRENKIRNLSLRTIQWQMFAALPIYITLVAFSSEFLQAWVGADKIYLTWPFIVTIIMSAILILSAGASMLQGINVRQKEMSAMSIVASVVNIIATYIFLQYFGLVGAIYGSLFGIFTQLPVTFYYYKLELRMPIYRILKDYAYFLILGAAAVFFKLQFADSSLLLNPFISLSIATLFLLALYLAAFFILL